jgi:hypothetical protein
MTKAKSFAYYQSCKPEEMFEGKETTITILKRHGCLIPTSVTAVAKSPAITGSAWPAKRSFALTATKVTTVFKSKHQANKQHPASFTCRALLIP